MSELIERLSEGKHPVEVTLRPERSTAALKSCIDRGFVHVRFTDTAGGTELGFALDRDRSRMSDADSGLTRGTVTLVGQLTLDFVPVVCVADIDLVTLQGVGSLERVQS